MEQLGLRLAIRCRKAICIGGNVSLIEDWIEVPGWVSGHTPIAGARSKLESDTHGTHPIGGKRQQAKRGEDFLP